MRHLAVCRGAETAERLKPEVERRNLDHRSRPGQQQRVEQGDVLGPVGDDQRARDRRQDSARSSAPHRRGSVAARPGCRGPCRDRAGHGARPTARARRPNRASGRAPRPRRGPARATTGRRPCRYIRCRGSSAPQRWTARCSRRWGAPGPCGSARPSGAPAGRAASSCLLQLAAALLVALGLAGGRRIDSGRDDFDRQGHDIDRGAGDGSDDAAAERQRQEGKCRRFMRSRIADAAPAGNAITTASPRWPAPRPASAASRRLRPRAAATSRPTMTMNGIAIGVIRSASTWSMVAEARSTSRTSRPSSVIRRRASSHAARSSRCCGS